MTPLSISADFERRFTGGPVIQGRLRLSVGSGPVTVLYGPSGSGKTTVLRCLAGLDRPERGQIRCGEEIWFDAAQRLNLPPQQRRLGYLFQDYALFPHLSVSANIAYGLSGLAAAEQAQRIGEMIELFGLHGLEGRRPSQLSGGQQQRVALARALARRPGLLLLDEPLSALDAPARGPLRQQLRRWLVDAGALTLLVTHDPVEALALGDSVVVMAEGQPLQTGSVADVFARPASLNVARLVGVDTIEPAEVLDISDNLATVAVGASRLCAVAHQMVAGKVHVCIRAEDVMLAKAAGAGGDGNRLPAVVRGVIREGPLVRVSLDCGFPLTALVTHHAAQELGLREGEQVIALVQAVGIHLAQGG